MWLHRVRDSSLCLFCGAVKRPQHAGKVLGRLWDLLDQNGLFMPLVCSTGQGSPCSPSLPQAPQQPWGVSSASAGRGGEARTPPAEGSFSPVLTPMQKHAEQAAHRSAIKDSLLPQLPASRMCWDAIKHLTGMGFKVHLADD